MKESLNNLISHKFQKKKSKGQIKGFITKMVPTKILN